MPQNRVARNNLFLAGALILFLTASAEAQKPAAKAPQPPAGPALGVEVVQNHTYPELHVDGKPFFIHSAAFQYFRIPDDLWESSLDRYRELGINTIDLQIPWNWHEPREGELDFDGHTHPRRNLRRLLRLIADKGFRLIVRPGPVVGADWRHGGYPGWLLERPEYGMSEPARREGLYPPLVQLGERDPEAEAAGWLENKTHMEYARRWLAAVARELVPYSANQKLEIEVFNPEKDEPEKREVSGPLLFVQLDGAHSATLGIGGPNYRRYMAALGKMLAEGGLEAPLAVDADEAGLATPLASGPAGLLGEWFLRPPAQLETRITAMQRLSAWDFARIESAVERLKAQPAFPPVLIGYQAGWLTPPDDTRPAETDPADTLLSSRLLIGFGAHGLNYFPLQDTLTPVGYDVPWTNRFYRWDAALEPGGGKRARARPVEQNGQLIASLGELLASSHLRADFGLVVTATDNARENWATWVMAMKMGRVAQLAGLTGEWLDPETEPVEHFLRHALVILPSVPDAGPRALSLKAQSVLVEYVRSGGTLAVLPPRPTGSVLDELWSVAADPKTRTRREGAGRVIELEKGFSSWVQLEESFTEARTHKEATSAVETLRSLLKEAGSRPVLRRNVNGDATGELVITELVSNSEAGRLGARAGGEGILSVSNLSDETAEETVEILSPASNAKAPGGGYLTLTLQVPPRESLLLPLEHSLCTTAEPREKCTDAVVASGAELYRAERHKRTLELKLRVPDRATVVLRLERKPGRVSLDEFRPEVVWSAEDHELRVVVPRGAWPDFERVLHVHMPYAPRVPEAPKKRHEGRRDFDARVVDAVRLPLGSDTSLPSYPPLVILDQDANGRMMFEATNYDEAGRDVDIKVEGPVEGDDGLGLYGGETDQTQVKLHAVAPAAAPEGSGLLVGEWEIRSGQEQRRGPIAFAAIPAEGTRGYRFDFDRDGADEWVLENAGIRLIVSPDYGGRALALVDKTTGINFLTSVGGMMSEAAGGGEGVLPRERYTAGWQKNEKQTSLRLSGDLAAGRLTKTIQLSDADTVEVEYAWDPNGTTAMPPVILDSVPATPGDDRGTRFCWKPPAGPANAPTEASPEADWECTAFVRGQGRTELPETGHELEIRAPGRATLRIEWDAGRMAIEMKPYSAMLRLAFPVPATGEPPSRHTVRYKLLPAN